MREKKADSLELARADAMMELIAEHCDIKVIVHTTRAAHEAPADATSASSATAAHGHNKAEQPAPETAKATAPGPSSGRAATPAAAATGTGSGTAEDLVEVGGLGLGGTTFVRRDWLDNASTSDPERELACDTTTGALVHGDVPAALARGQARARRAHRARERAKDHALNDAQRRSRSGTNSRTPESRTVRAIADETVDFSESYRVPDPMARLIRLRDGSCRFPGCATPARQCDLDHVRPWPSGPTSPSNLMALCRHHHRIKQRDGWTVTFHPDATVTWTDPTGRQQTTWPVDHLHLITAGHAHRDAAWSTASSTRHDAGEIATSFEEHLIDLLGGPDHAQPRAHPTGFDIDGNTYGGPPHLIDLDFNPSWDRFLIDFPPRPPQAIPF